MLNPQNLRPVRSKEEARIRGSNGGKASGEARRKKKEFRAVLEELLTMDSEELEGLSNIEAVCTAVLRKALTGDVTAATWLRDTSGQRPVDRVDQNISGPQQIIFSWMDPDEPYDDPSSGFKKKNSERAVHNEEANHPQPKGGKQQRRQISTAKQKAEPARQERPVSDDHYAPRWCGTAPDNMGQRRALSDIFDE